MTITAFDGYFLLKSAYIDEIIATPSDYLKVELTGNINCCNSNCGEQAPTLTIILPQTVDQDKAEFASGGLKVYPKFFGLTEFSEGIYKFSLKRFKEGGETVTESNCIFYDIDMKCKVAVLLNCILKEQSEAEKPATIAHLLHYSLINGSNCGCNCDEMCKIYAELVKLVQHINLQSTDCGC